MEINYSKYSDGLVPAVIQDDRTNKVLMLGFMNREALDKSESTGKVTFYSRSKKRLWTKGEESGHYLILKDIILDCDQDSLLIKASPTGPVCHTGADTCWNEKNEGGEFLTKLGSIIQDRKYHQKENSYISGLFKKGINKIAQKVGEEAVELVIEAKDQDENLFLNEAADLLFHYLILLEAKGHNLKEVTDVLQVRHDKKTS
ncbi:MAG TPA: bifunctional phosphoribosyl-AMP cyclohydrolase/phosphoribosyl-ATP diphosphatase HisIE [Puia sp.]|jgi:phosphoribosyl-ATP pyrophosphohydrolase/phosphoribosyl-AMP cyclohydrolase|nr:bifunctional phosphoribosyl-AMP cyclohydrolase/phosphoribosyl-ATP diphosphatase HisIE [Puia sp.]